MALRIGLAQINVTVGDMRGNREKMTRTIQSAKTQHVDCLVFPELCVCGYPPEDLLLKPQFIIDTQTALEQLLPETKGLTVFAGFAQGENGKCFNAAAVIRNGTISQVYQKGLLPNYGVFDEKRYFTPGQSPVIVELQGLKIAVTICEDVWDLKWLDRFLDGRKQNLDLLVNLSASPFHAGKERQRLDIFAECARHFNCPVAYCNLVGGQDELVFDGCSMILNAKGQMATQAREFEEDLCIADVDDKSGSRTVMPVCGCEVCDRPQNEIHEIYQALVLGTRDYVRKNDFSQVVVGLSGGIDSSLVAVIAADALGAGNVTGITMPSCFNTAQTRGDAEKLAQNLGIRFLTVPICETLDAFSQMLSLTDGWDEQGPAYENLQARIRGTILMSYSNQFGWLVLTTGNKSETAVGYSTLYGDTAGGFAVIKDVPKTLVYKLCEFVNLQAARELIPRTVLSRAPSAELRQNQKDTDSLPEYELLDAILKSYVELDQSAAELIKSGFSEGMVRRVIRLVDRNEYKRRQSPPGIKITPRAFGRDRRMPITNRYNP